MTRRRFRFLSLTFRFFFSADLRVIPYFPERFQNILLKYDFLINSFFCFVSFLPPKLFYENLIFVKYFSTLTVVCLKNVFVSFDLHKYAT